MGAPKMCWRTRKKTQIRKEPMVEEKRKLAPVFKGSLSLLLEVFPFYYIHCL